jgi:putative hemolysin
VLLTFFFLLLLLAFSASFSSFETALFSLSPVQRYRLNQAGGVSSLISKIVAKPRQLLTTVLFGNELVNVAIAIVAGGLAYDLLQGYWVRTVYLASIAVTTLVLLIFGEILPKNIAVRNPVIVSQVLVVPYQFFAWVVFPFRVFFTKIADGIVRLFGADPRKARRLIVEEELRSLLEHGKKEGTLADLERTFIQNALDFSQTNLDTVMTRREKIVAVSADTPLPEILKTLEARRFSRIPVYEKDLDHVIGILYAKELLPFCLLPAGTKPPPLREILKPHIEVSPEEALDHIFQKFQQYRVHMAIVKDRRQKVIGLITMDDLLRRFFP